MDLPIRKHRLYKGPYFDYKPRGGVRIKFCVVALVIELSLSLIDVIFFAGNENYWPFVHGFDNHVRTLSNFAMGNPFIGHKVVGIRKVRTNVQRQLEANQSKRSTESLTSNERI